MQKLTLKESPSPPSRESKSQENNARNADFLQKRLLQESEKLRLAAASRILHGGLIQAFDRTVSPARLRPYLYASAFVPEKAIQLYLWNIKIGQSFHFPIQMVEVALRNVISQALVLEFGQNWWQSKSAASFLNLRSQDELNQVKKRLLNQGIAINSDDIVAGMSLGFWVSLLKGGYNAKIWSKHLKSTFPRLPKHLSRKDVHKMAYRVLEFRNRVFHHEPLFKLNLSQTYHEIITLLGWVCPETQGWVKSHASITKTLRTKP